MKKVVLSLVLSLVTMTAYAFGHHHGGMVLRPMPIPIPAPIYNGYGYGGMVVPQPVMPMNVYRPPMNCVQIVYTSTGQTLCILPPTVTYPGVYGGVPPYYNGIRW
jgi:hypothetical protein